jgi:hypothetical protein
MSSCCAVLLHIPNHFTLDDQNLLQHCKLPAPVSHVFLCLSDGSHLSHSTDFAAFPAGKSRCDVHQMEFRSGQPESFPTKLNDDITFVLSVAPGSAADEPSHSASEECCTKQTAPPTCAANVVRSLEHCNVIVPRPSISDYTRAAARMVQRNPWARLPQG